jgi:hypothetical protein
MMTVVGKEPNEERGMKVQRWRVRVAAPIVLAAILLQGCATLVRGTSQKVPVTSAPAGARVLVDGKDAGLTPLLLKLKRKRPVVIRIEKEGYDPHEIRIERKKPSKWDPTVVFGNTLLAMPGIFWLGPKFADKFLKKDAEDIGEAIANAWWAVAAGYGLASLIFVTPLAVTDAVSGATYSLSPKSLEIELKPVGKTGRLGITVIDAVEARDIKWLRIRIAEGKEDR